MVGKCELCHGPVKGGGNIHSPGHCATTPKHGVHEFVMVKRKRDLAVDVEDYGMRRGVAVANLPDKRKRARG
jgi:hypothetical protein